MRMAAAHGEHCSGRRWTALGNRPLSDPSLDDQQLREEEWEQELLDIEEELESIEARIHAADERLSALTMDEELRAQQRVLAQANEAVVAAERHLVEMKTLPEKLPAIIAERTKIRDSAKSAYQSAQASEIQFSQKVDAQRKKVDGLTGQYLALLPK